MKLTKTMKAMKNNKRDWAIKDLICVAEGLGISCSNNASSHYIFRYEGITNHLSVPNHSDIHPDYITKFIRLMDKVEEIQKQQLH